MLRHLLVPAEGKARRTATLSARISWQLPSALHQILEDSHPKSLDWRHIYTSGKLYMSSIGKVADHLNVAWPNSGTFSLPLDRL